MSGRPIACQDDTLLSAALKHVCRARALLAGKSFMPDDCRSSFVDGMAEERLEWARKTADDLRTLLETLVNVERLKEGQLQQ